MATVKDVLDRHAGTIERHCPGGSHILRELLQAVQDERYDADSAQTDHEEMLSCLARLQQLAREARDINATMDRLFVRRKVT